ncbi:MAG TPA: ScyD/ScyE family protein [Egibacteraceae bacterium]|nr:ScyD/ScyE family protein [Egibacteraceae bacterium]
MHNRPLRRSLFAAVLIFGLLVPAGAAGAAADSASQSLHEQLRSLSADDPGSAPGAAQEGFDVVADGLTFPRGIDIAADGALYVIHAGQPEAEPEGPCVTEVFEEEGEEVEFTLCYMETGEVVRVLDGVQEAVVTGLPATGDEEGAFGPADVSVDPAGDLYMVTGLGGGEDLREGFGEAGQNLGSLFKAEADNDGFADAVRTADIAAYEFAHNPDEGEVPDSNPFAVVAEDGRQLVADAGGNTLLAANDAGDVTLEAVFPPNPQTVPPGLPGEGEQFDADAVPTGVVIGPDGAAYVTELPGGFAPDGSSRLWRYSTEEGEPEVFADDFTAAMDLDFGPDGSLYVLQLAASTEGFEDPEAPPPAGQLVRVAPDGTRSVVAEEGLQFPTGLAVGEDGIYVANCSLCPPGAGEVIRIDLPEEPADSEACPPDAVPAAGFTDVAAGNVHRQAIDCLAWWEITTGVTPTTYMPAGRLTRGQMAQFLSRAIHASDATLPPEVDSPFTDTEGSVHEAAIAALADAGVVEGYADGTFRPQLVVRRDQKASMLVRATEYVLERELTATQDSFTDDDGSVHEENINKAAEAGMARGVAPGRFDPSAPIRRDQAASFVARMLEVFVGEGLAQHP